MAPGRDEIETRIESLAREVADLRGRVHALESGRLPALAGAGPTLEAPPLPGTTADWGVAEVVGLAGRTLVILGGAFLLRAISAAAVLPAASGPALGLAYAAWWLVRADRSSTATSTGRTSAVFYGLGGIGIACPLLWEATARFHLLPGAVTAPALVAFLALGLAVARRRDLRALAWPAAAAPVATIVALLPTTHEFVLYTAALLVSAAVVEAFESTERWPELRWLLAAATDLVLLLLAVLVSQPNLSPELAAALPANGVIAVSLAAPVVYLASVATATLARRRPISPFELAQVSASLLCGIGTAMVAIAFHGGDSTPIAIAVAAIGAACYAVSFLSIDAAEHPRRNFYAYSSFAGVLVGAGTAMALPPAALAPCWLALAGIAVAIGVLRQRNTLRVHGSLYLAAAALASGLLAHACHGLFGARGAGEAPLATVPLLVLVGAIVAYAALARSGDDAEGHWTGHLPRFVVAAVVATAIAGLAAPAAAALLLHVAPGLDPVAWLASMRTAVVSVLAVALAFGAGRWGLDDLRWLVFPVMVLGGARLAWEDLQVGAPLNLFVALGFYGGALTLTSRLLRKAS